MVLKLSSRRPIDFPIEASCLPRIPSVWHRVTQQGVRQAAARVKRRCAWEKGGCSRSKWGSCAWETWGSHAYTSVRRRPILESTPFERGRKERGEGKWRRRWSTWNPAVPPACLHPQPPPHLLLDLRLLHCLLLRGLSFFLPSFSVPPPPSFALLLPCSMLLPLLLLLPPSLHSVLQFCLWLCGCVSCALFCSSALVIKLLYHQRLIYCYWEMRDFRFATLCCALASSTLVALNVVLHAKNWQY